MYFRSEYFQSAAAVYRRLCAEPGRHQYTDNLKGKWLREAGFETGEHLTVKISDGCIVIIQDSDELDELKHEQEELRQQLRDINQANRNMKNAAKAALLKIPDLTG
ncbi:SymE family type I addiction module toxin [Erwinia sorbitola]|uniref:SymE family type I addiction module toxin n=1 Tax=Erwinia sorbitola TaxID=2681984 RepID=UPI001E51869D|nr:SymE family type I addiction module toxin [Erwinia sorbitola]